MAFGNITTLYIPTAANAGSSLWGTDVRKLLSSADSGSDATTITSHGTSGATQRTFDPYSTSSADSDQSLFGWAIQPTDMNSLSGARRFYPAGNHTVTVRMVHSGAISQTGTLYMYVYRVASAASSRTRTLLGSNTASVALPVAAGEVTGTCTVALSEVIFDPDETVQYSFEFNVAGIIVTGETVTFYGGTQTSVVASIATPKLGVLADTTGTATGTGAASGVTGKVLGTVGSSAGTGTASGTGASRAATTGTAAGTSAVSGAASSVAGTVGTAAGTGTATGLMSIVLGTVGTVNVGASTPDFSGSSPTKAIAGVVTRGGSPTSGATCRLIRDSDGLRCATTTTDGAGLYSFTRDAADPNTYHVEVYVGDTLHGLTDRNLVPA